jgi:hypothetical protein
MDLMILKPGKNKEVNMEILKNGSIDTIKTAFMVIYVIGAISFIVVSIQLWFHANKIQKLRKEFESSFNNLKIEIEKLKVKSGIQ